MVWMVPRPLRVNSHLRERMRGAICHRQGLKNGDVNCPILLTDQRQEWRDALTALVGAAEHTSISWSSHACASASAEVPSCIFGSTFGSCTWSTQMRAPLLSSMPCISCCTVSSVFYPAGSWGPTDRSRIALSATSFTVLQGCCVLKRDFISTMFSSPVRTRLSFRTADDILPRHRQVQRSYRVRQREV